MKLNLYSQQRTRDRYPAIYMCKILDKLVPDPTPSALQPCTNERTGHKCAKTTLPTRASHKIKTLHAPILAHEGPKIFNSLPKEVIDIADCTMNTFKIVLDRFLGSVPDEPPVPGYTARYRTSTSMPAQVELMNRDARVGSSGGSITNNPYRLWPCG